jgi:class 3 adenylate cyclase
MTACLSCALENPEGQRFCGNCGSPLGASPARVAAEERKVVTALFCDLVGYTATSEGADPEDVDRTLAAYFEMARSQIEAYGGVVEKFIGDAVVGVFGVPAAHEDDPERAVRAGLRIVEDAEELQALGGAPLKLRVGINTGEALVRLGVSAASGEGFISGDSINTASRIQSIAPEMGVGVGIGTYEVTAAVFDYDELESVLTGSGSGRSSGRVAPGGVNGLPERTATSAAANTSSRLRRRRIVEGARPARSAASVTVTSGSVTNARRWAATLPTVCVSGMPSASRRCESRPPMTPVGIMRPPPHAAIAPGHRRRDARCRAARHAKARRRPTTAPAACGRELHAEPS